MNGKKVLNLIKFMMSKTSNKLYINNRFKNIGYVTTKGHF